MDGFEETLVVDNGSDTMRLGVAGERKPIDCFPTVITDDGRVGKAAQEQRELTALNHPIEKGIITDFDAWEKLWFHGCTQGVKVWPDNVRHCHSESPLNPKANREKMAQILFEKHSAPSFNVTMGPLFAVMAAGKRSGLVVDCGADICHVVPVDESHVILSGMASMELGGNDLDNYLEKMLVESGHGFEGAAKKAAVADIKEKHCYVAKDFDKEMAADNEEKTYELPGGDVVKIAKERLRCPEALFKPDLLGKESAKGIHNTVFESFTKVEDQKNKEDAARLTADIILSGGTTLFDGFKDRLQNELVELARPTQAIKFDCYPERKLLTLIGACLCGDLFLSVSLEEFNECGPEIVHAKCHAQTLL